MPTMYHRLLLRLVALLAFVSLAACAPDGGAKDESDVDILASDADGGPTKKDADPSGADWQGPRFRIATLNVHRFFDTVCDSGNCDGQGYERALSEAEFEYRARQIAEALDTLEADAILLQEMEKDVNLQAIGEILGPEYTVAEFGEVGFSASLDVGVLARGELLEVRKHRSSTDLQRPDGSSTSFAREFLEVHIERDGHRIIVFTTHFKAKANDDPGRRFAEAAAARLIVEASAAEFPDALVVMGGDLNDEPGSDPMNALVRGDLHLITQAEDPDAYWTFRYAGDSIAIDHLLIAATSGGFYIPGTLEVARQGASGFGGSDHAAVVADFALGTR